MKKVLLIYGGKSVEHEISVRSAKNVFENIDKNKFEVILVGISKVGVWHLTKNMDQTIESGDKVAALPVERVPFLIDLKNHKLIEYHIVFPILHGTDGEDGAIQGIFKSYNVPLVGCGVLGSSVSMDKIVSKKLLKESGVPVADYLYFDSAEKEAISYGDIVAKIGSPFMIKAGALGSSVGISKVNSESEFQKAIVDSFLYGDRVLIEKYIKGRELECGVIGNEDPKASLPGEIVLKKDYAFYDYQAKYQDDEAIDIIIPAKIDKSISQKIMEYCVRAYKALNCNDYSRADLFLTENNEIIINEINTIPGFTNVSMFPMLWQNMGMSYSELISALIEMAERRWQKQNSYLTSYDKA